MPSSTADNSQTSSSGSNNTPKSAEEQQGEENINHFDENGYIKLKTEYLPHQKSSKSNDCKNVHVGLYDENNAELVKFKADTSSKIVLAGITETIPKDKKDKKEEIT